MTPKYKENPTFRIYTGLCRWAVCCDVECDDAPQHTRIFSVFNYREHAEDFIRYFIDDECKDNFYICEIEI